MALVESQVHLRSANGTQKQKKQKKQKKRKRQLGQDEPVDRDESLFDEAQQQLQQEMIAAGMDGALPISFGSSRHQPRKRKRENRSTEIAVDVEALDPIPSSTEVEAVDESNADTEVQVVHESDVGTETQLVEEDSHTAEVPKVITKVVDKLHVKYDSDGEIADRVVESVAVVEKELPPKPVEEPKEIVPKKKKFKCPVPADVWKFWRQRTMLFYKYEEGIQLDHESWYSVTPQAIAEYIAERCRCDVVVDPFAGCGGNVIQLAMTCRQVIAIDIDPEKIRMAKHNAAIYGVADKIEFIVGNSVELLPNLKADVVFLSPPWGGNNYSRNEFSLEGMMIKGVSGKDLFEKARQVTPNVVYYLPKTTPATALAALSPNEAVECEQIFLNDQLKVMTAYYGDLATCHQVQQSAEPGQADSVDTAEIENSKGISAEREEMAQVQQILSIKSLQAHAKTIPNDGNTTD